MSRKHNDLSEALTPSINKAVAGQLADAMQQKNITKGEMAAQLKTSRAQVNRLLNPNHNPSLSQPETGGGNRRAASEYRAGVEKSITSCVDIRRDRRSQHLRGGRSLQIRPGRSHRSAISR